MRGLPYGPRLPDGRVERPVRGVHDHQPAVLAKHDGELQVRHPRSQGPRPEPPSDLPTPTSPFVTPTSSLPRCEGCNTHLMYQPGASSVRCALCQYVTQVGGAVPQAQQQPRQQQPSTSGAAGTSGVGGGQAAEAGGQGAFARQNSNTLYVIQNPSPEGEERYNMAIGVKVLDATGVDAGGSKEDGQQQKT